MIELICVILIIGTLAASALPSFLDFRNEARGAVTLQNLYTMRTAIKNQIQQVRLRCGITDIDTWSTQPGYTFYVVLYDKIEMNDMTAYHDTERYRMCTPAQLPDPNDRKLWDNSSAQEAHDGSFGNINYDTFSNMPANAFVTYKVEDRYYVLGGTTTAEIATRGGKCGLADFYLAINRVYHWFYNFDNGEIFPGTNTPGQNECNW